MATDDWKNGTAVRGQQAGGLKDHRGAEGKWAESGYYEQSGSEEEVGLFSCCAPKF